MQQVHKNWILNKFKFSDILYLGQDARFAKEFAYKQCYLVRRPWKDEEIQLQINAFLMMLLKVGMIEKAKKDGLNGIMPRVIRYFILEYAAVEPSLYSVKKRCKYIEAIRKALKQAIRLEPKWNFH